MGLMYSIAICMNRELAMLPWLALALHGTLTGDINNKCGSIYWIHGGFRLQKNYLYEVFWIFPGSPLVIIPS
jgi:hypothetical protein